MLSRHGMARQAIDARPRVLVVDDQEDVRNLLITALSIEGYDAVGARDARDGLRCLEDAEFSLVISDYAMPGGTGVWMLHNAGRRGLLDGTPSLIVTAHPDVRDGDGFEIVRKPLDLDTFLALVRRLLERPPEHAPGSQPAAEGFVDLVLYVSASSLASNMARRNLARLLTRVNRARVRLTVRDLSRDPLAGEEDRVPFTPTLVKRQPAPRLWIVGTLEDEAVLVDVLEGAGIDVRD